MVFKRRERLPVWRRAGDLLYPRGGWSRAFQYVRHRINRLPDTPPRIGRGIATGVFATFSPFFGFHFIFAALLAKICRGNMIASLLATFVGNPLTFPVIAAVNLKIGHFVLGTHFQPGPGESLWGKFAAAGEDFRDNFMALFSDHAANWAHMGDFIADVYLPYAVGGLLPGLACAVLAYYLSVPVVTAYQNRRRGRLKGALPRFKRKGTEGADEGAGPG